MSYDYIDEPTNEEEYFIEEDIYEEFLEEENELEKTIEPEPYSKWKKGKMYYDEKYVSGMILDWQKTTYFVNGVLMQRDLDLENKIMSEANKISLAIINQYRYHIFEDVEDLMQECGKEIFRNLIKFHPSKGTSFNYFSLICKLHLLNYTTRRSKHRNLHDVDEQVDLESRTEVNYDAFFDDLEITLFRIVNENYIRVKRKKYLEIASVLLDYLRKNKKYVSKSDLYSWGRSYGKKTSEIREFVVEMSKYKSDIFLLSQ